MTQMHGHPDESTPARPDSPVSPGADDLARLAPDRRSMAILLLRLVALVLMVAALGAGVAVNGLGDSVRDLLRGATPVVTVAPATAVPEPTLPAGPEAPAAAAPAGVARPAEPLATAAQVTSFDGLVTLELPQGTVLADSLGHYLAPEALTLDGIEVPIQMAVAVIGKGYVLGPPGATIAPPAALTMRYDPAAYYPFKLRMANCSSLEMATYDVAADRVLAPWLAATVDLEGHSVTTAVDRAGALVIFCDLFGPPISQHSLPAGVGHGV